MQLPTSAELPPFAGRHSVLPPNRYETASALGKREGQLAHCAPTTLAGVGVCKTASPTQVARQELEEDVLPLLIMRDPPPGAPAGARSEILRFTEGGRRATHVGWGDAR